MIPIGRAWSDWLHLRQSGRVHDPDVKPSWQRTAGFLRSALGALPDPVGEGVRDVIDYLDHNELGLTLDLLVEIGAHQRAPRLFWVSLKDAVDEMNLTAGDRTHGKSVRGIDTALAKEERYPCPCCGFLTHDEGPGDFEFCPVCGWQDDLSQLRFASTPGGANQLSLVEAQQAALASGVLKTPHPHDRDPDWRPLDARTDRIEVPERGRDYGGTYADDPRAYYYYWRSPRPE